MAISFSPSETRTFVVALIVIVSFILVFSLVVFFKDLETLKVMSAIWGTWVGSVIGYFFGTRPVEALIAKIDGITKLSEQRLRELDEEKKKYYEKNLELEKLTNEMTIKHEMALDDINKAKAFIQGITKKYLE